MNWNTEQTRILVTIEASKHLDLFLVCMDRLLRSTKSNRLLVLTSASSQLTLVTAWQTTPSKEDGQVLIERFPLDSLHAPSRDKQTRVCIATVRELQLQQIEQAQHIANLFDVIVAYDFPTHLSPVWKRVIEKLEPPSLIAFCENPQQEVIRWFEGTRRGEENEEGTTQSGFTQWSVPL